MRALALAGVEMLLRWRARKFTFPGEGEASFRSRQKNTLPRNLKKTKKNRIKKCRYLQESGCVGLCTNLCKRPTEAFFSEAFGLPLTMEPDFETLECTMRFGQAAPPIEEDAVYNQPCFSAVCSMASPRGPCPR